MNESSQIIELIEKKEYAKTHDLLNITRKEVYEGGDEILKRFQNIFNLSDEIFQEMKKDRVNYSIIGLLRDLKGVEILVNKIENQEDNLRIYKIISNEIPLNLEINHNFNNN